jgi:sugar O-acyltransferase (sialic acid O-acetyltransferase NeuD family)
MMNKVVIIGGKGTALVIADQIHDASQRYGMDIEMLGFAFDDESYGAEINGFPILCKTYHAFGKYEQFPDVGFIYSLYRPDIMRERTALLYSLGISPERFMNFVHPSVLHSRSSILGHGNCLLANSVVNSNVTIGNHNTFNTNTLIGHDTVLGNNNYFAAHCCIGSHIKIGNGIFVGMNSALRNFIEVGDFCVIGMGSNVTKSVAEDAVMYGNPAVSHAQLNSAIR